MHPTLHTRFALSMNMGDNGQVEAFIYKGYRLVSKAFEKYRRVVPGDAYVIKQ